MRRPVGLGPLHADARTIPRDRIVDMLVMMCWPFEAAGAGLPQARGAADAELARLEQAGLQSAARAGECLFDPTEVVNSFRRAALDDPHALYFTRFVPAERRRVLTLGGLPGSAPPPSRSPVPPLRVSLSLTRRMALPQHASRAARLSLPLPIEDEALTGLDVQATLVAAGASATLRITPGRLEVHMAPPFPREAIVRADLTFTAHTGPTPSSVKSRHDDVATLYTNPAEGLLRVTPLVRATAAAIAGNCPDSGSAILHIWRYLLRHLTCGRVAYGRLAPADAIDCVLQTGWADCHMAACLFAALCRARSIPARVCSGILLHTASPAYHSWAEAWCPVRGWLPYDFWVLDLSAAGQDTDWLQYFAGSIDYRCKTQILPRQSAGAVGPRTPWHMLVRPLQPGAETSFVDAASGALIYADAIVINDLDWIEKEGLLF